MIISSGYNIAGPEVEAALLAHAHVKECAVIGVADAERGQIVEAHVVLVEGVAADDLTRKILQDHVKATIAPYKYPRSVKFTDALPKTQTGKIQRFRLEGQGMTTDFAKTRALFHIPDGDDLLDGNSLGPLADRGQERVANMLSQEWGEQLIKGWNSAGWMMQPRRIGDRIGRLIGAPDGTVVMGDTLSIKVYQALASAIDLNPDRRVVLSDSGNFPSDLYMAQGLVGSLGRGLELKIVEPEAGRGRDRRQRRRADADRGRLPHRPPARHEGADREGACKPARWRSGTSPIRPARLPVDVARRGRGFRGRLHLQISERRARRAGLHLCRAQTCRDGAPGPVRLDGPRGAVRLRPRLPRRPRHRAHARRHAAGHRAGGARRRARRLGRRLDGRRPRRLDRR